MRKEEAYLQKQAEEILLYSRIPYIHLTTAITRKIFCPKCRSSQFKTFPVEGNKGYPDLTIFTNQGIIFVELKTPQGRLSPEQKLFRSEVLNLGYEYHIIRDLEDFRKLIEFKHFKGVI